MFVLDEGVRGLVLGLVSGSVSPDVFRGEVARLTGVGDMVLLSRQMLESAAFGCDSMLVECGVAVGHRFGFSMESIRVLNVLLESKWHVKHEDIVDAIGNAGMSDSVPYLARALSQALPYMQYDCGRSFRRRVLWALYKIGTVEAVVVLERVREEGRSIASLADDRIRALASGASVPQDAKELAAGFVRDRPTSGEEE